MRELTSKEAARGFSDAVNRAAYGGERVLLTRRGRRVAAIVPLSDLERLEACGAVVTLPHCARVEASSRTSRARAPERGWGP